MKDLTDHISKTQLGPYESKPLQELLQRRLKTSREAEIEEYLLKQKQRFFNALVVGTSGGDAKWRELEVKDESRALDKPLPEHAKGTQGVLLLDGGAELFTIDGQHRLEGIRRAIADQPKLAEEQVCIVLVKGITGRSRKEDEEGFQRTRRLFSALNRYAKPVGERDIIALDEDDVAAIVTRRLLDDYPLFKDNKVAVKEAKSLRPTDRLSITSIVALYRVLTLYFGGVRSSEKRAWGRRVRFRPSDDEIKEYYSDAVKFWDVFCKNFPPLQEAKTSKAAEEVAAKYRSNEGGHILFRPIGMLIEAWTVKALMSQEGLSLEKAVARVAKVPTDLTKPPWKDLLWDSVRSKMLYDAERQRLAQRMIFNAVGGNLEKMGLDVDEVRRSYAGFLRVDDVSRFRLPNYL